MTRATTAPHAVVRPASDDGVPVTIDRDTAREAAERELSEPVYRADEPGLVERAVNWFLDRVAVLLDSAVDVTPGGWTGLAAILLVAVALLVALRLRLGPLRRAPRPGAALFHDAPRSAADHRAAAERHATAREWTEAVQERMRAIVRALEERALLDPRPGRTADEAAREAGEALPGHAAALRAAARTFDEVTYAGHPGTEPAHARLRDLDTALEQARPRLVRPDGDTA
ncbi:DUF4129 domain-containing protein [Streptomyces sp. TRM 70351]|uniref:DUF4129 domain-containing protein n=1 Tax=Streptomyces sp. TRM 70351 TaxID=3116552 RepID=UPI002E7C3327|nr:DUF4129 domain-containing protein [Streptomyces sp. TRM 70351]MEE1928057.1 DUF4129 domain-containing protein [Streptomyces sp. TRM 70351]